MSHIGKLSRGLKWYKSNRDLDGVLLPHISQDYDKMLDVDYYLNYIKGKDKDAVEVALFQIYSLQHAKGGKRSKLYRDLKTKLEAGNFPVKETNSKPKEKK